MSNRSKQKGTAWESRVVQHLRDGGWVNAERRAQTGAFDQGDVAGVIGVCFEAKATARWSPSAWLRELDAEMVNSGCEVGAVWAKVAGKAGAQDGVILMSPATLMLLLKQAGY
jgi:hypothetical protein